jgi:L-ascorbate metabolism protein UlaG (beta-lactamase superfamily)
MRLLAPSVDMDRYGSYFAAERPSFEKGAVTVTFLGVSSLLFDDGETRLMIDGFFTRPSLLRTALLKIETDERVVDTVLGRLKANRVKALFVAHTHYDHALDVAYVVKRTGARLYGSASTLNVGLGGDLCRDQMAVFQPGVELKFGKFRVKILNSAHSPAPWINCDLGQKVLKPLAQPARVNEYKEGGSYDMLIQHGENRILVKPAANYVEGALNEIRADVLFLSAGRLGKQSSLFREAYYDQTVGRVKPKLVIPIHWDDFFSPLSENLEAPPKFVDDTSVALDYLIARTKKDGIQLRFLQGFQSLTLFPKTNPEAKR